MSVECEVCGARAEYEATQDDGYVMFLCGRCAPPLGPFVKSIEKGDE